MNSFLDRHSFCHTWEIIYICNWKNLKHWALLRMSKRSVFLFKVYKRHLKLILFYHFIWNIEYDDLWSMEYEVNILKQPKYWSNIWLLSMGLGLKKFRPVHSRNYGNAWNLIRKKNPQWCMQATQRRPERYAGYCCMYS